MNSRPIQATQSLFSTQAREGPTLCSFQFVGSILMLVGFFGPWVAHQTAALTVTGYELSEFAKFFPQVQSGTVPMRRALFITPLLASIISLGLVIHRSTRGRLLRLVATALIALIGLTALPPLQAILEPQYRLQLGLTLGAIVLFLAAPLARQLSERIRGLMVLLLASGGIAPALWQANLLRPLTAELYRSPIWPGWGLIVCAAGFLLLLIAGLRSISKN